MKNEKLDEELERLKQCQAEQNALQREKEEQIAKEKEEIETLQSEINAFSSKN